MKKLLIVLAMALFCEAAAAQDVLSHARELATGGDRTAALELLERHLADNPGDNDARTLYGIVLSWERRFGDARRVLQQALAIDPRNEDARLALANVDRWSASQDQRREVTAGVTYDDYDESSDWVEPFVSVRLPLPVGPLVVRGSQGRRFSLQDEMVEGEFYPRISETIYGFVSAGAATDGVLYPDLRLGGEVFWTALRGLELSAGARYLGFDDAVMVYTASVGFYPRNWYVAGRGFLTEDTTAGQLIVRRYIGEGGHYFGFRAGVGRDEIRSDSDVESLDRSEIAAEALVPLASRYSLQLRAGGGDGRGTAMLALVVRF